MSGPWQCPRCYELDRTPVRLVVARMDDPLRDVSARVCLRCAEVLWRRLQKVVRPVVRDGAPIPAHTSPYQPIPGGDDAEEQGGNRALPAGGPLP